MFEVTSCVWTVEDVVVVICDFYLCEHNRILLSFLKKTADAGQNFLRKYSYLKIKRKIISKLLLMQEPNNFRFVITKHIAF